MRTICSSVNLAFFITAPCCQGAIVSNFAWSENTREGHIATPKRRRYHSYGGEISPAPENIINRDFHAATPNEKWLTDITEFHIPAGKVYLSPMVDCFDGMVISWSIGTRLAAKLVNIMLDAAIEPVAKCDRRPVVHSDRGAHYRWPGWLTWGGAMPNSFGRCRAKGAHRITQPVKVSLVD
jgi:hypothetical protein